MTDWKEYAKSTQSKGDSAPLSVKEYALIKITDNWIAVCVLFLFIFCSLMGYFGFDNKTPSDGSKWFYDCAKLCIGVFLGTLTNSKSK